MESELYTLFARCLCADYTTNEEGADIAFERVGDCLFIFFEKSDGLRDWINNLSFCVHPYGDMADTWRCHGGFLRVFKSLRGLIDGQLTDKNIRSVTLVGYSHGAALALLAHEYIWFNYPHLRDGLRGFGYGCPRVVQGKLSSRVKARWEGFVRVSHRGDIVTHLPPTIFGFRHMGRGIRVGRTMLSGIDAHRPQSYLRALSGGDLGKDSR